ERGRMQRDLRRVMNLPDSPQRLEQNPALRLELFVEPQRRPIAAAAFARDRTRCRSPPRARRDELDEVRAREAFLHFDELDARDVAGKNVDGEDGKTVYARECCAARNQRGRLDDDLISDVIQRAPYESPRVSGKRDPAALRSSDSARRRGDDSRRGSPGCEGPRWTRRREGADPRGRPRQGRRSEAREGRRRGVRTDEEDDRNDARDAPDRPRGARRAEGAE